MTESEFSGTVRGWQSEGPGSGLAAAVVEVDPEAQIPTSDYLQDLGAVTRADGLTSARAVAIYGDWRAIRDLAEDLRDQAVTVRVGADGVPFVEPAEW